MPPRNRNPICRRALRPHMNMRIAANASSPLIGDLLWVAGVGDPGKHLPDITKEMKHV